MVVGKEAPQHRTNNTQYDVGQSTELADQDIAMIDCEGGKKSDQKRGYRWVCPSSSHVTNH